MYTKVKEEQKERATYQHDEIELRQVFAIIGNAIRGFIGKINYTLKLALKNAPLVLVIVAVSLGIGYYYFTTERPYYSSSLTLLLNKVRNEFVEDQMKRLTEMIEDGNHAVIASKLDISPEAAAQIKSVQFSNIDQDKVGEDSVLWSSPIKIDLKLFDKELFPTMETALIHYIETNKLFTKQKQIKEIQVRKLISKLRNDIHSIDSVKEAVGAPKGTANGFVYGAGVNPTTLYRESIKMYKEQVELEAELDMLNNTEVINGFAPKINPTGPKMAYYLVVSGVLGFILALIVAESLERKRRKTALVSVQELPLN